MVQARLVTLWRLHSPSRGGALPPAEWSCTLVPDNAGLRMEIARDGSPWLQSSAPSGQQLRKLAEAYRRRLVDNGWEPAWS